jgi:AcrR family transcriptional regulator
MVAMLPDDSCGRRERKKNAVRTALRSSAVRLVGEKGLDAVTIEDITEAADVSLRTFFNYFASKEEALTAPDPERLARLRLELLARPADEPALVALREVLVADATELGERRDEWLRQLSVCKRDPRLLVALAGSWTVLERELAAALADRLGSLDDDLQAQVAAAVAVGALRVAVRRWRNESSVPLAEVVRAGFDALDDVRHLSRPLAPGRSRAPAGNRAASRSHVPARPIGPAPPRTDSRPER